MSDVLSVVRLSAGYGNAQVLGEVSVSVGRDEVAAVLGANGSGKSTLIKSIMGQTTLYSGEIWWEGARIDQLPPHVRARRGLGYVPQTDNIFSDLSVGDNLRIGGFVLRRRELLQQLDVVYGLFPWLKGRQRTLAGSLSGGERRMLALGSCLMMAPRALLLDEPTADLAPAAIDRIFEKISQIRHELRLPIVLVEQNVRRALGVADRVCVLARGRNRLDCTPSEIDERTLGEIFLESGSYRQP